MGALYWLEKWVPMLVGVALLLCLCSVAGLLVGYTVQMFVNKQVVVPVAPIVEIKEVCTSEQAILWWNGSKDIKAAKKHLCSK